MSLTRIVLVGTGTGIGKTHLRVALSRSESATTSVTRPQCFSSSTLSRSPIANRNATVGGSISHCWIQ